jgi:hypothetical protein
MEIGDTLTFEIMDVNNPPTVPETVAIAFVPGQGFQWARYYNGSKSWQSTITRDTIEPTSWMKLLTIKTQLK